VSSEPFVVNVARLRHAHGTRRREVRQAEIDPYEGSAPPGPGDSYLPEDSRVTCDVVLESYPGGVMATGTVSTPWRGFCRRCTADVHGELRVAVRERFTDEGPTPDDDEAYPITENRLDMAPMVHDAVVLELPMAPLCHETCAGLCPWCGTDRNEGACDCVPPPDPRWASLDALRTPPVEASADASRPSG
jgi:uncharacterized protein